MGGHCLCCAQVRVSSDIAHVLSLPRTQLDGFLGAVGIGLASKAAILQALQQCKSLMVSQGQSWHTGPFCQAGGQPQGRLA